MSSVRHIAVVTGTRAEYGLLEPVLDAIDVHPMLTCSLIVSGSHLLPEVSTRDEIMNKRSVHAEVYMQQPGRVGRGEDAQAVARGIEGCIKAYDNMLPDIVLVLGDRIEAFAAASAASIGGYTLGHIHGGDRAEGVADEAMRHAITKLAHIHFPATLKSANRIQKMGEHLERIFMVGSPAADGMHAITPMSDESYAHLGSPRTLFLMHGTGAESDQEFSAAKNVIEACIASGPVLAIAPNTDSGSEDVMRALRECGDRVLIKNHLPRNQFLSLLKRVDALVGNSSAGLIEAAILGCPSINVGSRQNGRERANNVIDVLDANISEVCSAIDEAGKLCKGIHHPYGDGHSGEQIAEVLVTVPISRPPRKRNSY